MYPKAKALRLYDVLNDPMETTDLIEQPSMKPVVRDLFAKLQGQQKSMNDGLDLSELSP